MPLLKCEVQMLAALEGKPITRQDLYDLVWSMPVSQISPRFELSDNGFANMCEEWEIPRPPRGYWAKLRNGRRVYKARLKPIEEGNPVLFTRMLSPEEVVKKDRPPTETDRRRDVERKPENKIVVLDELSAPHEFVVRTQAKILTSQPDRQGIRRADGPRCLDVAVSEPLIDRSLRIFDALVKALEARGIEVKVTSAADRRQTLALVLGEAIGFRIREELEDYERPPTREEKEEEMFWSFSDKPCVWFESRPTGKLILEITSGHGLRRCWTDRSDRNIESSLNVFVVAMFRAAESIKLARIREEERHQEQEKLMRELEERERLRKEAERLRRDRGGASTTSRRQCVGVAKSRGHQSVRRGGPSREHQAA
jgi:hypothetical protein